MTTGTELSTRTHHRDRHTRRRERTRRKLLDAAKALFARQGVENTRINEITDEADVGFGSFYNHFESKEAIVEAVLGEEVAAHGTAVELVTADLDDPAEIVAVAHRYFVNLARIDPDWGWLLIRLDLKVSLESLGPFARRDLERGIKAAGSAFRTSGSPCWRPVERSRGHARRPRWARAQGRRPPPLRGRAPHVGVVRRGRSRGGAAADAPGPAARSLTSARPSLARTQAPDRSADRYAFGVVSSGSANAPATARYTLRLKMRPTWLPLTSMQSACGTTSHASAPRRHPWSRRS